MDIKLSLERIGLPKNEIAVYLCLAKEESLTPLKISKNTGIDRTLIYTLLQNLINKGLVVSKKGTRGNIYSITNPENLLLPIEEKKSLTIEAIEEIKKITGNKKNKVSVDFYEGRRGVQSLIKQLGKFEKFLVFGSTGKIFDYLFEIPLIVKKFSDKKIKAKIILSKKIKIKETKKLPNCKIKFLQNSGNATTIIFGDCVSIHIIEEEPKVIIIKNKEIAETYRKHFEVIWKSGTDL